MSMSEQDEQYNVTVNDGGKLQGPERIMMSECSQDAVSQRTMDIIMRIRTCMDCTSSVKSSKDRTD